MRSILTASFARVSALSLAAAVSLAPGVAHAGIEFVDQFRSRFSTQTGDGPAVTDLGYAFSTRLFASAPNFYNTVGMTGPGGTVDLTADVSNPSVYSYGSSLFASKSDMDAAFPIAATYDYLATSGSGPDATSLTPGADDYPQSTPYLAGTTYSDLQGVNAGQAIQVAFSSFDTGGSASESFIFFTIFDLTLGQSVYDAGFLPATTTGVTLGAGVLQAGHSFSYELNFSNRELVSTPGTGFDSQLGFDYRTSGTFSTSAVPEPSTLVLAGIGAVGILVSSRRGRRTAR
ncbi:PEP-CTERM sorting domain-containing protein [Paludisphaera mucosa]|uniref:PEP-CTERM sorting domain-containing protein n=1 Tax=Paludisphaera mucosa TaxID=3030827 RepID=A0ABT6F8W1_9BACT|nr:PEP-CTERM sorting domain-containing protein [Paludisphaera mucosa]MDG3003820.1 PEP-CTERM sorting domain-containing protein [Paludisphaera mucosa]